MCCLNMGFNLQMFKLSPGPEFIKLVSCSTQMSTKFQLLIKNKLPTNKEVSWFKYLICCIYSKTCLKRSLKMETKIVFQDPLTLNAGQKYCRMLQGEHSAKLSTFIKLPLVIKIFVLSIFEWLLNTGFIVSC